MTAADVTTAGIEPLDSVPVPTTAELQATSFKRGTKVRLVDDHGTIPAGTRGKVAVANGVTWKRYWLRLADGRAISHVDHRSLVHDKDYDRFLVAREREAAEAELAQDSAALTENTGASAASAGGGVEVNGVTIPQLLLDRSAAARTRLGG